MVVDKKKRTNKVGRSKEAPDVNLVLKSANASSKHRILQKKVSIQRLEDTSTCVHETFNVRISLFFFFVTDFKSRPVILLFCLCSQILANKDSSKWSEKRQMSNLWQVLENQEVCPTGWNWGSIHFVGLFMDVWRPKSFVFFDFPNFWIAFKNLYSWFLPLWGHGRRLEKSWLVS